MRLAEQVAIVTGAARGIGKGIATELAREGARGLQTEKELRAEGATVSFRRCDVSDEQAVGGLVDAVVADWGRLDLLVNNAAIGVYKAIDQATADDFDRCLAVNLRGPFLCTKHAARAMRATSGTRPPGGSIVNIPPGCAAASSSASRSSAWAPRPRSAGRWCSWPAPTPPT